MRSELPGLEPLTAMGRTCAVGVECGRDLAGWARRYAGLLPEALFDGGLFASLGLVSAFGSPWASAAELRAVSRAALWVFAVDHRMERAAPSEAADVVAECRQVAAGGGARSQLGELLAELRAELAVRPAFTALDRAWRDQLDRTLAAMVRERDWQDERARLTLDQYLAAADGCGAAFVNLSHWIATGDPWTLVNLEQVRQASEQVQRYLRLLNDLVSADRESGQGDGNALVFGITRAQVLVRMGELAASSQDLLRPIQAGSAATAGYLRHQLAFNRGFYAEADYWGSS